MLTATRLTVVLTLLVIVATAWAAPMKWTLGGYVQARYSEDLGSATPTAPTPGTFQDLRPAVLIRATDENHVFLQFFFSTTGGGTNFEVQHAFAEYDAIPFIARLGLGPIPFGYENPITSAALITTERSQVSNKLIGPNALDRGVFFFYQAGGVFVAKPAPPKSGSVNIEVGLVNGQPYNTSTPKDPNNVKNIVGRVGFQFPNGEIGVSVIEGKGIEPAAPTTWDRLGADLKWQLGAFTALLEYLRGDTAGLTANGGYLTVAFRPLNADGAPVMYQLYARGDIYDSNVDAVGGYFNRTTVGGCYFLNPTSKLQAEYQSIKDQANPDLDGNVTLQYQIIF